MDAIFNSTSSFKQRKTPLPLAVTQQAGLGKGCQVAHPQESPAFWLFALTLSGLQPQEDGDGKVFRKAGE